jgi:alcohol dehydrogenase (cytochrome c)
MASAAPSRPTTRIPANKFGAHIRSRRLASLLSETWPGDSWKHGGDAASLVGSYDPQLNLVYFGTSNAAPWGASERGPDKSDYGKFVNLYTASTLALDVDTGKIVWYYQTTPYDTWDYDGVNELVLADLDINGKKTPVALKADRNGFFYLCA